MPIEDIEDFALRQEYRKCEAVVEEVGKLTRLLEEASMRYPDKDLPIDFSPRALQAILPAFGTSVDLARTRKEEIERAATASAPEKAPKIRFDTDRPVPVEVPPARLSAEREVIGAAPPTDIRIEEESILDQPARSPVGGGTGH